MMPGAGIAAKQNRRCAWDSVLQDQYAHGLFLFWRRRLEHPGAGMRFEIISNDLKCILFEKYGFFQIKSPIRMQ